MTALTGLLDGETAAALKGLYGVDSSSDAPTANPEDSQDWSDYAGEDGDESYCDRCGEELTEADIAAQSPKAEEVLCGECDRRASSHAEARFVSTRSRERDLD